jgi:CheY-like chemotaxis protein
MGGTMIDESIPHGKRILVVNNDPDALTILEKKLLDTYPNCKVEKATSYREAVARLLSWTYDELIAPSVRTLKIFDIAQVTTTKTL